ncbi:hypothetical protein H920_17197 [Fukomys damarensis]|uniref:Uncharacterized protein n=1 Tax=Fukomys damarensis TaxID=885580 RepID=A0A091CTW2_FUKDA|nr:hypothetical protein H920_17197 [Fukomys damarensis]
MTISAPTERGIAWTPQCTPKRETVRKGEEREQARVRSGLTLQRDAGSAVGNRVSSAYVMVCHLAKALSLRIRAAFILV